MIHGKPFLTIGFNGIVWVLHRPPVIVMIILGTCPTKYRFVCEMNVLQKNVDLLRDVEDANGKIRTLPNNPEFSNSARTCSDTHASFRIAASSAPYRTTDAKVSQPYGLIKSGKCIEDSFLIHHRARNIPNSTICMMPC